MYCFTRSTHTICWQAILMQMGILEANTCICFTGS
jgi:hypothetical protein